MKNVYSYIRLSSQAQLADGKTGVVRQLDRAKAICDANPDWHLCSQSFADLGVSGFSGKNILQGNLGKFITLAKDKKLLPNPLLLIEQFDRFSRQDIDESEPTIIELLKSGVDIHVAFINKTFTHQSTKSLGDRIEIMIALKSAHEYSSNLSKRVSAAKERKRISIKNGEIKNLNEQTPWYIVYDKSTNTHILTEHSQLVKAIFYQYLSGKSILSITKELNAKQIKSPKGTNWYPSSIRAMLRNPALIGIYKGIKCLPQTITNEEDYYNVQRMLDRNLTKRGRNASLINIFRSLTECKCGSYCYFYHNKGRKYSYYRCEAAQQKICKDNRGMRANELEEQILAFIIQKDPIELIKSDPNKEIISDLISKKNSLTAQINKLLNISEETDIDELKIKLQSLKQQRVDIDSQLTKYQSNYNKEELNRSIETLHSFLKSESDDEPMFNSILDNLPKLEVRRELQKIIPTIICKIIIDFMESKVAVTLTNGNTIPLYIHV